MAKILRNRILLMVIALLAASGIALSFFWETIVSKPQLVRIFSTMSGRNPAPPNDAPETGESGNGETQEVKPGTIATKKPQDFQIILKRHLFGKYQDSKKTGNAEQTAAVQLTATSLDLSLLGTITGPPDKRRAVILDKKKKAQELYGQGDTVQGSRIKEIQRDKIILTVNGKDEVLLPEIPKKNPAPGSAKNLPAQQQNAAEAPLEEDTPDLAGPNEPEAGEPPMEPENPMEQVESTPEVTVEPMGNKTGNLPPVRRNQDRSSFKKNTQGKP